jgi:hypothetical protein
VCTAHVLVCRGWWWASCICPVSFLICNVAAVHTAGNVLAVCLTAGSTASWSRDLSGVTVVALSVRSTAS